MKIAIFIICIIATANITMAAIQLMTRTKRLGRASIKEKDGRFVILVDGIQTGSFDSQQRAEKVAIMNGYETD